MAEIFSLLERGSALRIADGVSRRSAHRVVYSSPAEPLAAWAVACRLSDNDIGVTRKDPTAAGRYRPGYEEVLRLVDGGAVDVVFCWKWDRFIREPLELEHLIPGFGPGTVQVTWRQHSWLTADETCSLAGIRARRLPAGPAGTGARLCIQRSRLTSRAASTARAAVRWSRDVARSAIGGWIRGGCEDAGCEGGALVEDALAGSPGGDHAAAFEGG